MQGEDERKEDNTPGEEETTLTTSIQVSLLILTIYVKLWVMDQGPNLSSSPIIQESPAQPADVVINVGSE